MIIGGIGVSGGSVEEDMIVAQAGLDVLQSNKYLIFDWSNTNADYNAVTWPEKGGLCHRIF